MPKMHVHDVEVQLLRKPIKTLRLAVYPPDGRVRMSVPAWVSDDEARSFVMGRLGWIKKQQARFLAQPRPPVVQMVTGESHDFFAQPYRLEVVIRPGRHEIVMLDAVTLQLFVRSGTSRANRLRVLTEWYRSQLKQRIPALLNHWQPLIGVEADDWGVKNMQTRWGSCNRGRKRIWLNLQLVQKPPACLEYVLVHELVHLLERYHNKRFYGLLDQFLPDWQQRRQRLNS